MCPLHCLYTQEVIYGCKLNWLYKQQHNLFRVRSKRLGKDQWKNKKGIVKRREVQRMQLYFCSSNWCSSYILTYFITVEFLCALTIGNVESRGLNISLKVLILYENAYLYLKPIIFHKYIKSITTSFCWSINIHPCTTTPDNLEKWRCAFEMEIYNFFFKVNNVTSI